MKQLFSLILDCILYAGHLRHGMAGESKCQIEERNLGEEKKGSGQRRIQKKADLYLTHAYWISGRCPFYF